MAYYANPNPAPPAPGYAYVPAAPTTMMAVPVAPIPGHSDEPPTADSPMGVLAGLEQAFISQKMTLGTFTCCQTENKYRIYSAKHKGQKVKKDYKLFKCKEHSTCLQRYCVA